MKWEINTLVHGFRVKRMERIDEVDADAYLMEHEQSGARLLYLDSPDDNKVFYIGFRTTPDNSKGTPHIMEHSTLCGSRKFPLKEPFVELVKGSLNTFLNAITWPDKTVYPVASRNDADFHNLMDVYLDAVFYPECIRNRQILMQEGWHYELENKDDPLTYNGVVYNEMKGALSSPEALMEDRAMSALFPDTTYAVESGGDPEVIPSLSFKEFCEFHRKYYHPSNSYIYLYGNMDIESTLEYIDREYLSAFKRRRVTSQVGTQSPFHERKHVEGLFGITENESKDKKTIHALYTAGTDHMSQAEIMACRILNYVLIEMDGAPLKKAITDAGIGSDVSGRVEISLKQPVWSIEVTGSEPDKAEEFTSVVDSTLRSLALSGIDREMLTAALNRMEFILRENDYQGRPKGLYYGIYALTTWLYDRDPLAALRYEKELAELREGIENGYFENILLRFLVKNTHQVMITMKPENGLTEKKNAETAQRLADFKSSLTDEQLDQIIENTRALKERQASGETEEALATIPLLSRSDLRREAQKFEQEKTEEKGITCFHYPEHTSGITYLNLFFTLYGLKTEDIPYAYLLTSLLGSMDTRRWSYKDIARLSNMYTGGLSFLVSAYGNKEDDNRYVPVMTVRGKVLTPQADHMASLLNEIINHTQFTDLDHLKELLLEEKSSWDMSAFNRGHVLVMGRLLSYFSGAAQFREQGSLSYYAFLNDLVAHYDERKEALSARLSEVAGRIFNRSSVIMQTIGGEEEREAGKKTLAVLTADMPEGTPCHELSFHFPKPEINEGFISSGKVQYVAAGGNFRRHGFTYTGALQVMETILRYEFLWKKVRVQGGAYGAMTSFAYNGDSVLCSYRDPNLKETLGVYKELPNYLRNFDISEREMTKYVIGTMAASETQLTPPMKGQRAMSMFFSGMTQEDRQAVRNQIIDCTVEDIRGLADLAESVVNAPYFCVMGSEDKLQDAKDIFGRIRHLGE
jgi:Zn-dependent M16 (insulinase) family peptidase